MSIKMSDVTHGIYSKTAHVTVDLLHPKTNLTLHGAKTFEEIQQEYPDAEVMTFDDIIETNENLYKTEPQEITKEQYWEMLECLPPVDWTRGDTFEYFKLSERISGSITGIYIKYRNKYYTFSDSIYMKRGEILNKLTQAL